LNILIVTTTPEAYCKLLGYQESSCGNRHSQGMVQTFPRLITLSHAIWTADWAIERRQRWKSGSNPTRASTLWGTIPNMAPPSLAVGGERISVMKRSGHNGMTLGPRGCLTRSCGVQGTKRVQTRFFSTGTLAS